MQRVIPPFLLIFTKALLSSKKNSTFRSERLIDSLCHDICLNLTNGQWKTPKHLLLGLSHRHITGSSKVVTFLDLPGHCVSHSTVLELETAMCDSVKENDSNLKSEVKTLETNLCHAEFDNVVNSEKFNTIRVFQGTSKMWKTWKYSKVLV